MDKRKKIVDGTVIKVGNSGATIVPKEGIGKMVRIQIIEEDQEEDKK